MKLALLLMISGWLGAAVGPAEILLWPNGAPGSEGKTGPEVDVAGSDGMKRIAGVHRPSITAYLPVAAKASGAAAVILPGGGHRYLSIDNEGHAVARWLSERGVAAFVLKYRLARENGSTYRVEVEALADAQRAIRLLRHRAKEWKIDAQRVGVIGFSAGGQVASLAASRFDGGKPDAIDAVERESSRPAFQALLYSGAPSADEKFPKDAPPAFICVAFDDRGPAGTAGNLFQKFRDAGIETELHIYAKGGHGFGMKARTLPISSWPDRLLDWMGQTLAN